SASVSQLQAKLVLPKRESPQCHMRPTWRKLWSALQLTLRHIQVEPKNAVDQSRDRNMFGKHLVWNSAVEEAHDMSRKYFRQGSARIYVAQREHRPPREQALHS